MRTTIALVLILAACSGPTSGDPAVANTATPVTVPLAPADNAAVPATAPARLAADYAGRWIGVEGMYLNVTAKADGGMAMEMQYDLDHKGTFEGRLTPDGLSFVRDGKTEVARPTDGDATALKYLAGKKDCLTVKPGEGYCRD